MTKQEFEERIGGTVSASRYDLIEEVYNFHPSIDNVKGKDEIAKIYTMFGMRLIYDMLPTAREAKRIDNDLAIYRSKIEELQAAYDELKRGY